MSLGRRDWVPTPFTEFLFPSGKSLSTFVTQFPRCQMSKYLLTMRGGMELQKCRGFITSRCNSCSSLHWATFSWHGLLSEILLLWKVWWKISDFVGLWWKICQRCCFETLQDCISAVECLIYQLCHGQGIKVLQLFNPSAHHWAFQMLQKLLKYCFTWKENVISSCPQQKDHQ